MDTLPFGQDDSQSPQRWETELFVLRAESRDRLGDEIDALDSYLERQPHVSPVDVAFTLNADLPEGGSRLALVASSVDELRKRLAQAKTRLVDGNRRQIVDVSGIYYFAEPLYGPQRIAFLFPGEGAQYPGMVGDLCPHFPEVSACLDFGDAVTEALDDGSLPVSRFLRFDATADGRETAEVESELRRLDNAMFSVLMANWGIIEVLDRLNLKPAAAAGHSAGELAALMFAGAFDATSELSRIATTMRSLADEDCGSGSVLLAVGTSRANAEKVLAEAAARTTSSLDEFGADVAMDNCPHQTVIVGLSAEMDLVESIVQQKNLVSQRLELGRPYHTSLFEPYMDSLTQMFDAVDFRKLDTPVYSCTTGKPFPTEPALVRQLAVSHWKRRVEFTRLIQNMYEDGIRLFVEVGPRGNLCAFVQDILRGRTFLAVPADVLRKSGVTQLNHMAGQLAAHGVPLDLAHLYRRRKPRRLAWRPQVAPPEERISATSAVERLQVGDEPEDGEARRNGPRSVGDQRLPRTRAASGHSWGQLPASNRQASNRTATNRTASPRTALNRTALMQKYWSVMSEFLDTQQSVMQQYVTSARQRRDKKPIRQVPRHAVARRIPAKPTDPPCWPLLGEVVRHASGRELVTRRRLRLEEDRYAAEHTVGGRSISRVEPDQHGMPIMPMTFTLETMAEIASVLVPGKVVVGMCDVKLMRWLALDEEDPVVIEVTARTDAEKQRKDDGPQRQRVAVEIRGTGGGFSGGKPWVAALGTVLLDDRYPEPPQLDDFDLSNERPCPVTLDVMYQNLFHGEIFQGVERIDRFGDEGVEATIRVPPRDGLFTSTNQPPLHTDPVLLDIAMHPMVAWHLEKTDQSGRIVLPYDLKKITIHGPPPAVGAVFRTRGTMAASSLRHFTHSFQILDDQGQLWASIERLKLWRFYLPFHDVNFHGPKDVYILSDEWPEALPEALPDDANSSENKDPIGDEEAERENPGETLVDTSACCVRLELLTEFLQPALLSAAARVCLSSREQQLMKELECSAVEKAQWLLGRIAAKDAARILWRKLSSERHFMADVETDVDENDCCQVSLRGAARPKDFPNVDLSRTNGLLAALASTKSHVGVAARRIEPLESEIELAALDDSERELLRRLGGSHHEQAMRFYCAKQAVARAMRRKAAETLQALTVRCSDRNSGSLQVALADRLAVDLSCGRGAMVRVTTARWENFVVATTAFDRFEA